MKKPISSTNLHADFWPRVVALHGWEAQIRQLSEEMAELTVALNHLAQGRSDNWRAVAVEVADVLALLEQVPHIVAAICDRYAESMDLADFDATVARKTRCTIAALMERLAEEEGVEQ